ncbi:hypothetical protein [Streptomyces sasae]|uniref:hypothetical protein n=1 Tax=Streptomyces sasae TaxID=1266772 RepID=UPI00292CABD6|nr:hypothetical protein [Streptomyces sasae]
MFGPARTVRSLGRLTGKELIAAVQDDSWGPYPATGLRHGEIDEWVFVVKYDGRQAEFGSQAPVSRGGPHVFELEFEEENGKPVPPQFSCLHDDRLVCAFNLHVDGSWGYYGVKGDREVAVGVQEMPAAAGLPDADMPRRDVYRTALEIIER